MADDPIKDPQDPHADDPAGDDSSASNEPETLTFDEHKKRVESAVRARLRNHVPKADHEKIISRVAQLEAELKEERESRQALEAFKADIERVKLRDRIGKDSGLPQEWWEDVTGSTESEMKSSAERIRKKLGIKNDLGNPVPPKTGEGAADQNTDMNRTILGMFGLGGR